MFDAQWIQDTAAHKGVRFFLERARKLWSQPFVCTPVIFGLAVAVSSLPFFGGIRSFFILYLIVALVLSQLYKNVFIGVFLTFLFTLQFVHPNKIYEIEIIRGSEILERLYSDGYRISYFFHLATFFFVLSFGAMVREAFLQRKRLTRRMLTPLLGLLGIWMLFLLEASFGISRYSPYSHLSLVWMFQYSFMYFIAIGIAFGLMLHSRFRDATFVTFASIVCVQFGVSILQLIMQRSAGFPFEATSVGSFSTGLDENNAVFRVMGSFMFPNQLSFVMGVLLSLLLPYALQKKSTILMVVVGMTLLTIALTQTRSIFLSSAIICFINLRVLSKELVTMIQKIGTKRIIFLGLAAFMLSAFSIIPRILLSVNTGYAGAGFAIRLRMFNEAGAAIVANPWVGYGVGTNEYVLHKLFPDGVMSVFPAVVHMAYLQLWMEVGILGLIIILFPLLYLLRFSVVKNTYFTQKFFRLGYIDGLITVFTFWALLPHIGIVEFPFIGLILGFGVYWYYLAQAQKHEKRS